MSANNDLNQERDRAVATVLSILNSRLRIMSTDMEKAVELVNRFNITADDLLKECRSWAERC